MHRGMFLDPGHGRFFDLIFRQQGSPDIAIVICVDIDKGGDLIRTGRNMKKFIEPAMGHDGNIGIRPKPSDRFPDHLHGFHGRQHRPAFNMMIPQIGMNRNSHGQADRVDYPGNIFHILAVFSSTSTGVPAALTAQ